MKKSGLDVRTTTEEDHSMVVIVFRNGVEIWLNTEMAEDLRGRLDNALEAISKKDES